MLLGEIELILCARNIYLCSDVLIQRWNGNLGHEIARVYDANNVRGKSESMDRREHCRTRKGPGGASGC